MSISEEDFVRLQEALMQVKTEKYESDAQRDRLQNELAEAKSELELLTKEHAKASKSIAKSKKAKEVKAMIDMHEQEKSNLEMQNKGLLTNLQEISSTNEALLAEIAQLKGSDGSDAASTQSTFSMTDAKQEIAGLKDKLAEAKVHNDAQLADLKARNANLLEKLQGTEEKYQQLLLEKSAVTPSSNSQNRSQRDRGPTLATEVAGDMNTEEDGPDSQIAEEGLACKSSNDAEGEGHDASTAITESDSAQLGAQLQGLKEICDSQKERLSSLSTENSELRAKVVDLEEAEVALKQQLETLQQNHDLAKSAKSTEFDQLEEKYRKKQAAYLELQKEKEESYQQHVQEVEALTKKHESELKALELNFDNSRATIEKASADAQKSADRAKDVHAKALQAKESEISKLQDRVTELEERQKTAEDALAEVNDNEAKMEQENNARVAALEEKISELAAKNKDAEEKLAAATKNEASIDAERETFNSQIAALEKSVEKWKQQVDEFSREAQQTAQQHRDEMEKSREQHASATEELKRKYETELAEKVQINSSLKAERVRFEEEISSLEEKVAHLDKVEVAMEDLRKCNEDSEQRLSATQQEANDVRSSARLLLTFSAASVLHLKHRYRQQVVELEASIVASREKSDSLAAQVEAVRESVSSQSKKDAALIKELKKQLKREQRKAERESATASLRGSPTPRRKGGHQRTPSTASIASIVASRTHSSAESQQNHNSSTASMISAVDVDISESEQSQLLGEVVHLRTEAETLRHRVRYLESKVNDIQADATAKALLLDTMTNAGSPAKRKFAMGKDKQHTLKDSNEKMRTLLEETLMKNIQLEQLVEALTRKETEGGE